MNWTQQQLVQMPEPDLIVHIGAGVCSELPDYQHIQPRQIVLVEPNPETCAELHDQATRWDNVTVMQAAVTDRTSSTNLRLFNFSELDSLHEPVGLYNLLPGLRQIGRTKVATLSARQLIEQLPLAPEGHNWLVLEAPGEELEILTALADCQGLEQFSNLIVRAGSEAFYNDTPSSSPLVLETLEQLGYTPQARADQADADWPRHHLRLDRMALECRRLKAALAKSECQHQTELRASQQKQAQAEQDSLALKDQLRQLKVETQQVHDQQGQRLKQLESVLGEKIKQAENLEAALETQKQKLASTEVERSKLFEQFEVLKPLETRQKETQKQLEQITQSRDNLQKKFQKHTEETHKARIRLAQLEEENEEYEQRHKLLEEELIKAEAQIELIKKMFLSSDDALDFNEESEKD